MLTFLDKYHPLFIRVLLATVLILIMGPGWGWLTSSMAQEVKPVSPASSPLPLTPRSGDLWEDVKKHGAKGDGKTDDTQAIQKAIDAAAGGSKVVLLPSGVYRTSGPGLRITTPDLTLRGLGKYASVIQHTGSQPALTVGLGKKPPLLNVRIADLHFQGTGAQGDAIFLHDYTVRYAIENVSIVDFAMGTAIKAVDHNHSGHISQVDLFRNGTGVSIGDHGQFTDISFSKIAHNKRYGVVLADCNVINIISTQLEKNGENQGASVLVRGVDALNLIGCYNEQNHIHTGPFLILARGTTGRPCRAVNLVGCRSIGNKKAPHSIVLESAHNVNFTGNLIQSFTSGIFVLRPPGPGQVKLISGQGNVFEGALGADVFSVK